MCQQVLIPCGEGYRKSCESLILAQLLSARVTGVQRWLRCEMRLYGRIMFIVDDLLLACLDIPTGVVGMIVMGMAEGLNLMRAR